jgi:hypothetical protein
MALLLVVTPKQKTKDLKKEGLYKKQTIFRRYRKIKGIKPQGKP